MTEKELHKLRRHDLLQLLLAQGREAAQLQAQIDDMTAQLETAQETNSRFIGRLDDKDAQIEKLKGRLDEKDLQVKTFKERLKEKDIRIDRLKGRLDQKDEQIEALRKVIEEYRSGRIFEMEGDISIAEIARKLEGIFAAAQKAVDQYLDDVRGTMEGGEDAADDGEREVCDNAPATAAGSNDTGEQNEEETDRSGGPDA